MDSDKKKLEQIANQIIYGGRPGIITFIENSTPTVAVRTDVTDSSHFITIIVAMIKSLAHNVGMEPLKVAQAVFNAFKLHKTIATRKENV